VKIDRRNPRHWLWLSASLLWAMVAAAIRPFTRRRGKLRVLLYGHKLGGNLLALYQGLGAERDFEVAFLSLDPRYARELAARGEDVSCAASWRSLRRLVQADAIVSDHGLHALEVLLHLSDLGFFDTWHGIPFKGFDHRDFRVQRIYREVWVASPSQRRMWIERFGFDPGIVEATGYPRTDRLVRGAEPPDAIKRGLGVDPENSGKLILFAPTWRQDDAGRSLFPFGLDAVTFLAELSSLAQRCGATVLLRTHLNSGMPQARLPPKVVALPYARFPDTEAILLASDLLVCDWSSIAFDFLLLSRPTVFLDVPAPFAKGFSLDPSYRFGAIADGLDGMSRTIESFLRDPAAYEADYGAKSASVREAIYGECADGGATARCIGRLRRLRS